MSNLQYDSSGFIVGTKKLEKGLKDVQSDTQTIIDILKGEQQNVEKRTQASNRNIERAITSTARNTTSSINRSQNKLGQRQARQMQRLERVVSDTQRANDRQARRRNNNSNANSSNRQRGADGRFIGNGSDNAKRAFIKDIAKSVGNLSTDTQGIDPLLDSMNEVKTLTSPLKKGFGLFGRAVKGGSKWSWSKIKALKRKEPLPNQQERHNRMNERYLRDIRNASGGGGGLLSKLLAGLGGLTDLLPSGLGRRGGRGRSGHRGGRFGRLGRGFARGGGRLLGGVGALLGVGFLASEWGNLDHKGKSRGVGGLLGGSGGAMAGGAIGATIGSVVPVIGTAIGGLVGAGIGGWLGSDAGEKLGETASPYIQRWTNNLSNYNLPAKLSNAWEKGTSPFFEGLKSIGSSVSSTLSDVATTLSNIAQKVANKAGEIFDDVSDGVGNAWNGAVDYVSNGFNKVKNWLVGDDVEYRDYGSAKKNKNWLVYERGFNNKIRNKPLSKKLVKAMDFIGDMGLTMKVASGGQDAKGHGHRRTGSTRHDNGNAADVDFYDGNRKLSFKNKADRARLSEIVRRAKGRGLTGFGAGGKNGAYMGDGRMHIGYGSKKVWGHAGKSVNAPDWLIRANNAKAIKSENERGFINKTFGSGRKSKLSINGTKRQKFFQVMQSAKNAGSKHPEVVASQWAIESGWGKHQSGKNNYFGIKATKNQKGTYRTTKEQLKNGKMVTIRDKFRDFDSLEDGLKGRINFVQKSRYWGKNYNRARTPREAVFALRAGKNGGYATDKSYNKKLFSIMTSMGIDINKQSGSILGSSVRKPTPKIVTRTPKSIARPMPKAKLKPVPKFNIDTTLSSRLDSGGKKNTIVIQGANQDLSQNVSDRDIAHAISGGLGGKSW